MSLYAGPPNLEIQRTKKVEVWDFLSTFEKFKISLQVFPKRGSNRRVEVPLMEPSGWSEVELILVLDEDRDLRQGL
jgi:hypothetical protein